ncbi:hypothetical protein AAG906_030055 [Vitis piasezkii]
MRERSGDPHPSLAPQESTMYTSKGTEEVNLEGAAEIKVETVDHQSPAGKDQAPKQEHVQVIHEPHDDGGSGTGAGGSVLGSASAAVAHAVQSAKDAISANKSTK